MSAPSIPPPQDPVAAPDTELREGECPRCGASYGEFQEYCLECGIRLPGERGVTAALVDARRGRLGDWAWPLLFTFVVALLAGAVVVVAQYVNDPEKPFLATTPGEPAVPPVTETQPVVTETAPEAVPQPPPPPASPPPPPRQGRLVEWPAGVDAYTIVLASMPASGGRATATRNARQASDAGLPRVGVLDSAKYSSLHPGYFVVFSGVYDSLAEANRFLDEAHDAGFDTAYARLIAS